MHEIGSTEINDETGPGRDFIGGDAVAFFLRDRDSYLSPSPHNVISRDLLPVTAELHTPRPRTYDFQTSHFPPLVSPKFKNLIESTETAKHQFIPVAVKLINFPNITIEDHYFMIIVGCNAGINIEKSRKRLYHPPKLPVDLAQRYGQLDPTPIEYLGGHEGRGWVFENGVENSRHLWRFCHAMVGRFPVFASDVFVESCQANGITGLVSHQCVPYQLQHK